MRLLRSPRRSSCGLVAVLTAAGLLSVPAAVTAAAPPRVVPGKVRLATDDAVVRSAEVPVRAGVTRLRTTPYSLVAATWRGPAPRVSVRTGPGRSWQRLPALADGPDAGAEGTAGLHGTDLVWTGPQQGIDIRVRGKRARDVELVLIDPGSDPDDGRAVTSPRRVARATPDTAPRPRLRTRKAWGADPSWRNGRPHYNRRLKQVHLHHTATGSNYRRADVPGIIRGMYRYHTQTLGWFDIGYNFLVDRFGRIWVGRSGGAARLVRGAHTLGFNHMSVGIAVIGNFQDRRPRKAIIRSVARLAAWKLDRRHRRARGRVWVTSMGSDKYPEGERVGIPAFDGHRDTNDTACPGDRLYSRLPVLRRRTQRRINYFS